MKEIQEETINIFNSNFNNTAEYSGAVTPVSLMILGDHTHYNEGVLLSCGLNSYSCVILQKAETKKVSIISNTKDFNIKNQSLKFIEERNEKNFVFTLLNLLIQKGLLTSGFNAVINLKIPRTFGLGTIASVQMGILKTINREFALNLSDDELINISVQAERISKGKISNTGHHHTVLKSKKDKLISTDLRTKETRYNNFTEKFNVITLDTGIIEKNIKDTCNERIDECNVGVKSLRLYIWGIKSLRDVKPDFLARQAKLLPQRVYLRCLYNVTERERVEKAQKLLNEEKFDEINSLISESHQSLNLDYNVSVEQLNYLEEQVRNNFENNSAKMISCSTARAAFSIVKKSETENFIRKISHLYKIKYKKQLNVCTYNLSEKLMQFNNKALLDN